MLNITKPQIPSTETFEVRGPGSGVRAGIPEEDVRSAVVRGGRRGHRLRAAQELHHDGVGVQAER